MPYFENANSPLLLLKDIFTIQKLCIPFIYQHEATLKLSKVHFGKLRYAQKSMKREILGLGKFLDKYHEITSKWDQENAVLDLIRKLARSKVS